MYTTIDILTNGTPINPSINVQSITINKSVNYTDKAEIDIIDGGELFAPPFPVFNSNVFQPGTLITIYLGYDGAKSLVFEGMVLLQVISASSSNPCVLKLTCIGTGPLIIGTPRATLPPPVLELSYGENILSFSLTNRKVQSLDSVDWLRGFIETHGSSLIQVNNLITIRGLGSNILLDAYIASVDHIVDSGNWVTRIELGKPKPIIFPSME